MQKILVTGGAGFIGSHLCEYLLNRGYKVTCLDNLVTGSKKNIEPFLGNPDFEFIEADVVNLPDHLSNQEFSHVFDLASPASPVDFEKLSEEILTVNSVGVLKVLELAKKCKAKFLMASTSEVYGDPMEHPQKETYFGNVNSFGRRSCYDEGKRFAEAACHVYLNKYDVDLRIVRIFNTYGPRMRTDDGRALISFVMEAINKESFTINGDGLQTRSPCYVTDMVEGLYKAMFTQRTKGEVFNLGNPEEVTMIELIKRICKITGTEEKFIYNPSTQNDPLRRCPDISKAKKYLDWEPKINLDEGLQKTIKYYQSI